MKNIKNLLIIITILSVMVGIITSVISLRQNREKNRMEQNLYTKQVQWEDERGRLVTETTELRYTVKELRQISKKDSSKMSSAEKQLLAARGTIDDLNIKLRKVESVDMIELISRGKYTTDYTIQPADMAGIADTAGMADTHHILKIDPIKTKFLDIEFLPIGDSLMINHTYRNNIDVIIDRDQKLNIKGQKRFFLMRWINPNWQYSSNVVSEDPNAKITSNVYIKFQRGKGKR